MLDRQCFPESVRYNRLALDHYLSLPNALGLVEAVEGTVLGFIIVTLIDRTTANIVTIDVTPSHRNNGLGSSLIELTKRILTEWRVNKITLQVANNNIPAINFYKKHGFKIVEKLPGYYPETDGYGMELIIR